jgi:glyoxylase-like metal-dependent hydrolase (beta-lactamase superfamily II)/rhodanese-related sulfurtransferase
MRIRTLSTPELGDRSYVVDDGTVSVVIDPQRDLDRLDAILEHDVTHVLETHIHNDYVTGGLELARRAGAEYGVNAADDVAFERSPLADGQELRTGALSVTVLATPGHTPTHLSYVVRDLGDPDAAPAVFSGGSLLYGTVGRTDLVSAGLTRGLAADQYRSAHRLAALPEAAALFPTHGFGSFCAGGGASGADASTIADERAKNLALTAESLEEFVAELLGSFTAYPSYYAHMAPLNRTGPGAIDLSTPLSPVGAATIQRLLAGGATVVDLRPAADFAAAHLAGSMSVSLGAQFATYVGWLAPWGRPLAVLGEDRDQLEDARRQLARIGVEELSPAWGRLAELAPAAEVRSYRRATFDELAAEAGAEDVVVDVRRDDEFDADHVRGALGIPLHQLETRSAGLPRGHRIWVYCAGGFRAGTAASLLDRVGIEVVHVDDGFDRAVELGLTGVDR